MVQRMQPDDELWEFSSPPESWAKLHGRKGFAVVRAGEIVDALITAMN